MWTNRGNPRCWFCMGKGVVKVGKEWRKCSCTIPSKTVQELMRRANARSDRPYRNILSEEKDS